MLINTIEDLVSYESSPEKEAFLLAIYNDFVTFDDADYPEGYDRNLGPDDEGYVEPVLRQEWNAGAAAGWGFLSREQIQSLLE
jgi:hypothetical protein